MNERFLEPWGVKQEIIKQARFFPEEGLSYQDFLKVMLPPQQSVGRQLLQQGYLIKNDAGGIVLSPIMAQQLPPAEWDEPTRAFLTRQVTSLAEMMVNYWEANRWVKQARRDSVRFRELSFMLSRDDFLQPLEQQAVDEAMQIFKKEPFVLKVIPKSKQRFLASILSGIGQRRNLDRLKAQAMVVSQTIENILSIVPNIPEHHLLKAHDWLSDYYFATDIDRLGKSLDMWRLLSAASRPSFQVIRDSSLGILYDPNAKDQTIGAFLKNQREGVKENEE